MPVENVVNRLRVRIRSVCAARCAPLANDARRSNAPGCSMRMRLDCTARSHHSISAIHSHASLAAMSARHIHAGSTRSNMQSFMSHVSLAAIPRLSRKRICMLHDYIAWNACLYFTCCHMCFTRSHALFTRGCRRALDHG